ncbi:unnamed protein product, partial [Symbiodinium microadriaticum]
MIIHRKQLIGTVIECEKDLAPSQDLVSAAKSAAADWVKVLKALETAKKRQQDANKAGKKELVNTIDVWKRAYERICIARDEMEEDFESQLVMKDKQLRKMALDSAEEREAVKKEIESWKEKVLQVEEEWKMKMVPLHVQKDELEKKIVELERNVLIKEQELRRALRLADSRLEDPEKEEMKRRLKELESCIKKQQEGIQVLIEENTKLRENVEEAVEQAE